MFRVFGVLFLALGLIVLSAAALAVVRGRIWRDPLKLSPTPAAAPSAGFTAPPTPASSGSTSPGTP